MRRAFSFGFAAAVLLVGCANPVPPSGGPRDETPPSVVQTRPVRDTVNVSTDVQTLRVQFSEYIERTSLPQALSVTPPFERRPQFDWSGRSVEIEFPTALRDSTTYIFSFDSNLSDAHGVSLDNPITVAFSTGPRINQGQIQGRVVGGRWGRPKQRVDVYAYALSPTDTAPPRPLPDQPRYRTQTGEEGRFDFDYMREQRYYVVALRDNNRNRQPDPLEPYAPPPRLALRADSGASPVPVPWLLTRSDTVAPTVQRVQPLSRRRFQVNFDEPVQIERRAPAAWTPRDSATGTPIEVRAAYADPTRADAVVVRTARMRETRYVLPLEAGVVADTAGQRLAPDTVRFGAAAREDTTRTRFRGFLPANLGRDSTGARPLLPDVQPGVRFNQTPDSTTVQRGLSVRDTTGQPRGYSISTEDGTAYRLQLDPPLAPGQFVDVTVSGRALAGADTTYRRRFRRLTRRALGGLEGRAIVGDTTRRRPRPPADTTTLRVPAPLSEGRTDTLVVPPFDPSSSRSRRAVLDSLFYDGSVVVELTAEQSSPPLAPRRLTTRPESTFVFRMLPEGQVRFRAYLDRNGNEQWDGGQLQPYVPAEPKAWLRDPVEVRPRWTTDLPIPLRIPVLAPIPTRRRGAPSDTLRPPPGANR